MGRISIGIAGAGPAGLAAAILLKRAGHAVVVIDQFAEPAPVGSGLMLQPTGLSVLRAMGLDPVLRGLGAPVDRILGKRAGDGRTVLDVSYAPLGETAFAIHRSALFGLLFEAATAEGVEIAPGFRVEGVDRVADGRLRFLDGAGRALGPFDLVIDALGARSPLTGQFGTVVRRSLPYGALWATVPWPGAPFLASTLEQRYRRASTMVGLLPVGARWGEATPNATFFWSLRGEAYAAWRDAGLNAWKAQVLAAWPELEPVLDHLPVGESLTFARYSHHTLARPVAGRLVAIGDAAHATSPQLGQGANMALLDAFALAAALQRHGEIETALVAYAAARHWHVRLYQLLSAVFTPLYQSDSRIAPRLRDHVLRPLALTPFSPPILAAAVSGKLLAPRPPAALVLPIGHTT